MSTKVGEALQLAERVCVCVCVCVVCVMVCKRAYSKVENASI